MPHLALGVLLVVTCATGFAVVSTRLDDRVSVLALAEPVTVGQVLTAADLREVRISADSNIATIASSRAATVVGATMAVSLPDGSLLSPVMLGDAAQPEPGKAIVAVAVAPGQFPPEVVPGSRVVVVPAPAGSDEPAASEGVQRWVATVVGVHVPTTDSTTVVSLQLAEDDASQVAAAASVRVVMVSAGGGE